MNTPVRTVFLCRSLKAGLFSFLLLLGSLVAQAQTTNTWTGGTSDWSTTGNWTAGVPDATHNVVIPPSLTNYPILSTTATAKSVEVQSGASLSISSAGSLSIDGSTSNALSNSGTVTNEGALFIGSSVSVTGAGIINPGIFRNQPGGNITINRTGGAGLDNQTGFTPRSPTRSVEITDFVAFNSVRVKQFNFQKAIFEN